MNAPTQLIFIYIPFIIPIIPLVFPIEKTMNSIACQICKPQLTHNDKYLKNKNMSYVWLPNMSRFLSVNSGWKWFIWLHQRPFFQDTTTKLYFLEIWKRFYLGFPGISRHCHRSLWGFSRRREGFSVAYPKEWFWNNVKNVVKQ